ncbi:hypothetical protein GCM10023077_49330 [Mycolicibacterium helvum]
MSALCTVATHTVLSAVAAAAGTADAAGEAAATAAADTAVFGASAMGWTVLDVSVLVEVAVAGVVEGVEAAPAAVVRVEPDALAADEEGAADDCLLDGRVRADLAVLLEFEEFPESFVELGLDPESDEPPSAAADATP